MPRFLLTICGAALLAASFAHTAGAVSRKAAFAEIEATRRLNMEQAALNRRALPPEPTLAQLPPRAAPIAKVETRAQGAMVPVSALTNPPRDIAIATVRDAGGTVVGAVQRVELASSGAPSRLEVAMLSDQDHLVSLDASRLRYDAQTNEVRMSRQVATN
jgi:glucose/arabinose dehydrogenase